MKRLFSSKDSFVHLRWRLFCTLNHFTIKIRAISIKIKKRHACDDWHFELWCDRFYSNPLLASNSCISGKKVCLDLVSVSMLSIDILLPICCSLQTFSQSDSLAMRRTQIKTNRWKYIHWNWWQINWIITKSIFFFSLYKSVLFSTHQRFE